MYSVPGHFPPAIVQPVWLATLIFSVPQAFLFQMQPTIMPKQEKCVANHAMPCSNLLLSITYISIIHSLSLHLNCLMNHMQQIQYFREEPTSNCFMKLFAKDFLSSSLEGSEYFFALFCSYSFLLFCEVVSCWSLSFGEISNASFACYASHRLFGLPLGYQNRSKSCPQSLP